MFLLSENLNKLPGRVASALKTSAVETVKKELSGVCGTVLTVGTGGSYAAAVFAAKMINEREKNCFAVSSKPRDALLYNLKKLDLVFLFSYSGTTNDIKSVYLTCKEQGVRTYVVTALDAAAEGCPYEEREMISYCCAEEGFEEKGFISMASTLIPMCVFAQKYYEEKEGAFVDFLQERFAFWKDFFEGKTLLPKGQGAIETDIFSGYDTVTASTGLESDIVESGIGRATVHEKKDFSHGRYNAPERRRPDVVVFLSNETGDYSDKLKGYLRGRGYPLSEIKTECRGVWGDLDLAIAVQFFVAKIGEERGYDMSDPVYPEEAKALYKYVGRDIV